MRSHLSRQTDRNRAPRGRRGRLPFLLIVVAALGMSACQGSVHEFTVRVNADPDVKYSGQCVVEGDARAEHSLEGKTDEELVVEGVRVSCLLQKTAGDGALRAEILMDEGLQAYGRTADPFGTVNVTTF